MQPARRPREGRPHRRGQCEGGLDERDIDSYAERMSPYRPKQRLAPKSVSFAVPRDLLGYLDDILELSQTSRATFVRDAVRQFLESREARAALKRFEKLSPKEQSYVYLTPQRTNSPLRGVQMTHTNATLPRDDAERMAQIATATRQSKSYVYNAAFEHALAELGLLPPERVASAPTFRL